MTDAGDVRLQLNDLEAEEARIMRELRELDEKAMAETEANRRRAEQYKDDPDAALTSLLLECEKEVRDAKGYIADDGPPLRIVRLRRGETGPKTATYLSRPRNTGVDFTVPVTLKAYTDLIKRPIFLNQIRDKIKQHKYVSTDDYLDDMRLLAKNTAQFNKGPDLAWVVQHARFLLDAAEDAVQSRKILFREVEEALRQRNAQKIIRQNPSSLSAVGKRKRTQTQEKSNGDVPATPPVGSAIEIYWPSYRKWYLAYIIAHGDGGTCHLRYDEDNSVQWVTLDHERWRMRNSRVSGAARGKRAHEQPAKRRKAGTTTSQVSDQPSYVPTGITPEDLDAFKIDLFAKFDDLRESIVEYVKDHFTRLDREIIRSDTLSRILVQGEDNRVNTEGALQSMERRYERLEKKVDRVCEKLMNSSIFGHSRKDHPKEDISGKQETSDGAKADGLEQNPSHSGSAGPGERDTAVDNIEEYNNAKIGGHPTQTGNKPPEVDSAEVVTDERSPNDANTNTPVVKPDEDNEKQEASKDKEERQESENEHEEVQKTAIAEKDVDMLDLADSDSRIGPDTNDDTIKDDTVVSRPTKVDGDVPLERGYTKPVRGDDDIINIEEHDKSKDENDRKMESDESSDSDDSESAASVERGKTAGKQPATRRPVEEEPETSRLSKDPADDPDQESREAPEEKGPLEKRVGADVSTAGENENDITVEERKTDDQTSKEKPSEELETPAASAGGSEATEHGKDDSPNVREPNLADRDTGD